MKVKYTIVILQQFQNIEFCRSNLQFRNLRNL
jgi:hypothetical protein